VGLEIFFNNSKNNEAIALILFGNYKISIKGRDTLRIPYEYHIHKE